MKLPDHEGFYWAQRIDYDPTRDQPGTLDEWKVVEVSIDSDGEVDVWQPYFDWSFPGDEFYWGPEVIKPEELK